MKAQLADGTMLEFPEGTSPDVIQSTVKRVIASRAATPKQEAPLDQNERERLAYQETVNDMGTLDRLKAGAGKAFNDTYLRGKQLLADPSSWWAPIPGLNIAGEALKNTGIGAETRAKVQKEIDDAKRQAKPLLQTAGGKTGEIGANIAQFLPTAFIPGANTYTGATLLGAAQGYLQPVASDESALSNTASGAAGGFAGQAVGNAIGAGYKAGKDLISPFFEKGREKLIGKVLRQFAGGQTDDVIKAAENAKVLVPGSNPTLAEAAQNPSMSGFQLAVQNANVGDAKTLIRQRDIANNAARVAALENIAGDEAKLAGAKQTRDLAAETLYGNAFKSDQMRRTLAKNEAVDQAALNFARRGGMGVLKSPEELRKEAILPADALQDLMKRPSFKEAVNEAKNIMANKGQFVDNPLSSLEGLHTVKIAIDNALAPNSKSALANADQAGLRSIKERLLSEMEKVSPTYASAKKVYQQMSPDINQMEVGQYILAKAKPAITDYAEGATSRTKAEALAQALRNADHTAQKATGFKGAKFDKIMTPEQINTYQNVARDLARKASADEGAKTIGSNTAQNLITSNLLNDSLGAIGLPKRVSNNALVQSLSRPIAYAYRIPEQKANELLVKALLDPQYAAQLMRSSQPEAATALGNALRALPGMGGAIVAKE